MLEFYAGGHLQVCYGVLQVSFPSKGYLSLFYHFGPKNANPRSLKEYRPICLVGCLYKIVSKVLANRINKVLKNLIFQSQPAFVPGRQILDGGLALNEIIDHAKKCKKECFIFKSDF